MVISVLLGKPSSVALPFNVTVLVGSVIVWFGPAFTTGAWFCGVAVMVVVAGSLFTLPSLTINCTT